MGNSVVGEMEGHVFFKIASKADSFSACDQGDTCCSVVWRNLLLSSEPTLSELPLIGHVVVRNTRIHARLLKVVLLYSTIAMKSLYALTVNPVKCEPMLSCNLYVSFMVIREHMHGTRLKIYINKSKESKPVHDEKQIVTSLMKSPRV